MAKSENKLKCPPNYDDCETDPIMFQTKYASTQATSIILNAIVIGLAIAIASILAGPINALVSLIPNLTNTIVIELITIAIYFIFAILIILLIMRVNKRTLKMQQVMAFNKLNF